MTKPLKDRNFDPLIAKFEQKVYGTVKGSWRLQCLQEDLAGLQQQPEPLTIWDAGCGLGQMAAWFAKAGHQLTLSDLSKKMVTRAAAEFSDQQLSAHFLVGPTQALAAQLPQFDLVMFHAVLEWLAEPEATFKQVLSKVKPGGYLSVLFYNRNAIVYTNVLKGRWRWQHILDDGYIGKGKKLTPPHPHYPETVRDWLAAAGFECQVQTGIRVFHDYLTHEVLAESNFDELMALETQFCRRPTYRDMGRYIHILAYKPPYNSSDTQGNPHESNEGT